MVSITQIQQGTANYVDKYLLPQMPFKERIVKGTVISLLLNKLPVISNSYVEQFHLKELGIMDDNNNFDIELLANVIVQQFNKVDNIKQKLELDIPAIGILKIDSEAIEQLKTEILSV